MVLVLVFFLLGGGLFLGSGSEDAIEEAYCDCDASERFKDSKQH
jgi:hypothetical protein